MSRDQRGGLAQAAGGGHSHFFIGGPGHGAGSGGHREQTLGVVLAPATAEAVVPVVAETSAPQTTDEALRDHLIKTLPVLLRDEDPDKHDTEREKISHLTVGTRRNSHAW